MFYICSNSLTFKRRCCLLSRKGRGNWDCETSQHQKDLKEIAGAVLSCPARLRAGAMGNFFSELKRRHIYRVAAAYAVLAWLLLQIVNNVIPIMQSPAWV